MATGFEEWLFGYAGTKVADRVLALLRGDPLTADLHKAVEKWAGALPAAAALASSSALFPSHVPDDDLHDRPNLARLRAELEHSRVPTVEAWKQALLEQWQYVRTNIANPQAFFLLSESEASVHVDQLAARLGTVCAQYEPLFRATTITLLRELLAQSGVSKAEQPIAAVLTDDQKALLKHLYQHKGLCRISAAKGEFECLWVPGTVMEMQWGWERTPEEAQLSGKPSGSREDRLRWLFVVRDLTEAGIFESQPDGYYEFTEAGWRVAHDLVVAGD